MTSSNFNKRCTGNKTTRNINRHLSIHIMHTGRRNRTSALNYSCNTEIKADLRTCMLNTNFKYVLQNPAFEKEIQLNRPGFCERIQFTLKHTGISVYDSAAFFCENARILKSEMSITSYISEPKGF